MDREMLEGALRRDACAPPADRGPERQLLWDRLLYGVERHVQAGDALVVEAEGMLRSVQEERADLEAIGSDRGSLALALNAQAHKLMLLACKVEDASAAYRMAQSYMDELVWTRRIARDKIVRAAEREGGVR